MNSKRVFYLMVGGLAILIIAVLGSAYAANLLLEKQAKTLNDLKLASQVGNEQQSNLVKAKKDITKYEELDNIARTVVPQDKDQAQTIREIVKIAQANDISLSSLTFPTSTLGTITSGGSSTGSTTPSSPTSTPATSSKLTQVIPVKGYSGLYDLQITIVQDPSTPVDYSNFIGFLAGLEQNRRTAQVSSIVLQPSPTNHNKLSFNLVVNEYIKP